MERSDEEFVAALRSGDSSTICVRRLAFYNAAGTPSRITVKVY